MPAPHKQARSAPLPRIAFQEAITQPKLLQPAWQWLTKPQQVILLAAYGLPLRDERDHVLWSAFQGAGVYDGLGYLTGVTRQVPYNPKEYETVTCIIGRRASKSTISCFAAAYEITCGGHTSRIEQGQDCFWLYLAQDLATAVTNSKFIRAHLEKSPILRKEIAEIKADEFSFKNGIVVRCEPPNVRTGRGSAVMGWTGDEVGLWYKDSKNANPDFEVVAAVDSALDQFHPYAKNWRISTPWTPEGLLYQAHRGGTEGYKIKCEQCSDPYLCTHVDDLRAEFTSHLVIEAPTAALENPTVYRARLASKKRRDPDAFERENLARFTHAMGSFLPPALVAQAIDKGIRQREPKKGVEYVGVMDPAFRHDTFAFQVWHHEPGKGMVQDLGRNWEPTLGERLNPRTLLGEIATILPQWDIQTVFSDQYQLESLQAIAEDFQFSIIGVDITRTSKTKIVGNFSSLLRQGHIHLLDDRIQEAELLMLQKIVHPNGYVTIAAPGGKRDDRAMCATLGAYQCLFYQNDLEVEQVGPKDSRQRALLEQFARQFSDGEMSEEMMQSIRMQEMWNILAMNQDVDEEVVA